MSQGGINDPENDLMGLSINLAEKISVGVQKTRSFFSLACIYRVPEDLRKLRESAYTPRLIAIGPLHREDKHLQTPLQHVKMSYLNDLLSRLTAGIDNLELAEQTKLMVLKECLAEMKILVDDVKKCYAVEVTLNEEMMLVDGCFVLEFLDRYPLGGIETDPIFASWSTVTKVKSDLILLENQIPLFVLEKLLSLTMGRIANRPHNSSLTHRVLRCYHEKIMKEEPNSNSSGRANTWFSPNDCVLKIFGCKTASAEEEAEEVVQSGTTAKYYHILHKLHDGYFRHDKIEPINFHYREMPSALELVYAGVKFVPYTSGKDLFKFKFSEPQGLFRWFRRARFEIPPLALYDTTKTYLRNLIALEQCCDGISKYVSSYALVMDTLINTEKDIQLLEKAGVLRNHLGASKDATDIFNNLCKEIISGDHFLDKCREATKYSKRCWPRNMSHVRRTYLASPWTFAAFCVGFIAFVISVVQFVRDFVKKA